MAFHRIASCVRLSAIRITLAATVARGRHVGYTGFEIVSVTRRGVRARNARPLSRVMSAVTTGEVQLEVEDIEIILGLLTPRSTSAKSDTDGRSAQAADVARVVSLVRSAYEELQRRHSAREATATAILALAADALS